ncbi:MAG: phage protein GemA/Gp16 family protein [Nitrospiria bacterium]
MERVTSKQIKALWGYSGRLHLSEEDLRGWIYARTGKRSIRALTKREASRLIGEMAGEAYPVGARPHPNRITAAQAGWMKALGRGVGWNERRILGLARKMYHIERLDDLGRKEASGVIEALKGISRRNPKARVA